MKWWELNKPKKYCNFYSQSFYIQKIVKTVIVLWGMGQ